VHYLLIRLETEFFQHVHVEASIIPLLLELCKGQDAIPEKEELEVEQPDTEENDSPVKDEWRGICKNDNGEMRENHRGFYSIIPLLIIPTRAGEWYLRSVRQLKCEHLERKETASVFPRFDFE